LLAELMLDGRIDLHHGRILVVNNAPVRDLLCQTVLEDIVTENKHRRMPHTVRIWLVYLGHSAVDLIRGRLCVNGIVEEIPARRWWGSPTKAYRATDVTAALGPEAAVHSLLAHREPPGDLTQTVTFAALADACGLLGRLTWWHEHRLRMRRRLAEFRAKLPRSLGELVDHTEAAVGDAVLSQRTSLS
jgi:Golgi phosphoprotein 3 GPP34